MNFPGTYRPSNYCDRTADRSASRLRHRAHSQLADYGLVEGVGRGVYRLTDGGEAYRDGGDRSEEG